MNNKSEQKKTEMTQALTKEKKEEKKAERFQDI